MTKEEDVLAALDKPRAVYALQQFLDPAARARKAFKTS
jgi:hypothetical protein